MTLMKSASKILKTILHVLFVLLLSSTAFIGIAVIALSVNFTDQERVKSWPLEAGVYNHITDNLIDLTEQGDPNEEEADQGLGALLSSSSLDASAIEQAINDIYPPQYWQSKYEGFVDDVYAWLDGHNEQLQYDVDFNDKKQELADALTVEIANQLAGLSTCQPHEVTPQFDVLQAECLPPGVTATQAASQFEREIIGSDGPLAEDLRFSSDGSDIEPETQTNIINLYNAASSAPFTVTILLTIFALLVAVTGRSFLRGLRRSGLTLFSAGIVSWISFFLLKQLGDFNPSLGGNEAERRITEDIMAPLAQTITGDVADTGMWSAIAVVVAGALLWLGAYIWHKAHHHAEAEKIAKRSMAGRKPAESTEAEATLPKPVDPSS